MKERVLVCDINKILGVALASGTAGLNSASKVPEPDFSTYVYQALLLDSILEQTISDGHNRHFPHILPSSKPVAKSTCFILRAV